MAASAPETLTIVDAETVHVDAPAGHKAEIRLWLRLLTCTMTIETSIRRKLRERFDVTLPRFDLMAQLEKAPDGMTLGELSKRMMVSNGNLTGLVERLAAAKLVDSRASETDRRAQIVRLTAEGRAEFAAMAVEHESWVAEMMRGLSPGEVETLMRLLAKLKRSAHIALSADEKPAEGKNGAAS
ncbi:MAG: MarR family transcriptional regulator [Beijerinckiaceae bacterium]|nr:MarR family transcriptional regulator [Beijerinckiaceae bacterium]